MMSDPRVYDVAGMTCGHCKAAIEREVGELAAVSAAEVDVAAATLTVTGNASDAEVRAAVEEAGYEVTGVR